MGKRGSLFYFLVGGVVASVAPSPTDFIHFYLQKYLTSAALSSTMFWGLQAVDWYIVDTLWWVLLLGLYYLHVVKRRSDAEAWTVIGIVISLGAIIGLFATV